MASHDETNDFVRTLPGDVEQAAARSGLLPLVAYTLERAGAQGDISGEEVEKRRMVRRHIAVRNMFLFDELRRVLGMFNDAGIRVIVLKGAALVEGLYPHLGLRPFGDIDLLIHRHELPQVIQILSGSGYRPDAPLPRPGAEDFQHAVTYVKHGGLRAFIDIHWTLGPPYPYAGKVDMDGLWQRARKAEIAGVGTLVLCPEDFLLHLCLHVFDHCQRGWVTSSCDIAELVHRYEGKLDWEAFLSRVFQFKICLPVQYGLQKTFTLFKPPVPPFVLEQLGSYKPGKFERWAFSLWTRPRDEQCRGRVILARLLTIPGAALKLRYLWTLLSPSRDFLLSRYAGTRPRLLPLYYLLYLKDAFLVAISFLPSLSFKRKDS